MEDLFDILIVVAFALIGIAAKSSKSKKTKPADKPKSTPKPPQPAKPAKAVTQPSAVKIAGKESIESAINAITELLENADSALAPQPAAAHPQQPAKAKKKKKSASGESKTDEHGCIGGSIPHMTSEGESLQEHAQHEKNRQARLSEENALRAESLRKPTAADLRKAVVMKEILDKPVALRGRRI